MTVWVDPPADPPRCEPEYEEWLGQRSHRVVRCRACQGRFNYDPAEPQYLWRTGRYHVGCFDQAAKVAVEAIL